MDLREANSHNPIRHPWETTRLKALQKILAPHLFEGMRVLDEGCGDGFVARNLFSSLREKSITAVDSNLGAEEIQRFSRLSPDITYLTTNPAGFHDLILLLDVLEHIEDDLVFLDSLAGNNLVSGGKILITVPAFQSLFSRHDEFLGHYRRYTVQHLEEVARRCNLSILSSGYLFSTLLIPKLLLYRVCGRGGASGGVGSWDRGKTVSAVVETILNADNSLLLAAQRAGVRIPGLSAWALCRRA